MPIIKKSTNNKCWLKGGKKGNPCTLWWYYKFFQPLWNSTEVSQKTKNRTTYDAAIPLPGIYPRTKTNLKRHVHPHVYSSTIITPKIYGKHPSCPSRDEWIKEMWPVCVCMKYYSAIKKKEICHLQQHGWTGRALCQPKS